MIILTRQIYSDGNQPCNPSEMSFAACKRIKTTWPTRRMVQRQKSPTQLTPAPRNTTDGMATTTSTADSPISPTTTRTTAIGTGIAHLSFSHRLWKRHRRAQAFSASSAHSQFLVDFPSARLFEQHGFLPAHHNLSLEAALVEMHGGVPAQMA